jgi:hypothetical protein
MEASERTVVSQQRVSRRNMLNFLDVAVAAQRLAMVLEHQRTCLRAPAATATILCRHFQTSADMDPDYKVFDER